MNLSKGEKRPESIREATFAGVRWSGGAHVVTQAIKFGVGIVLARLLTPEPFGIIGMAVVITGFMTVVSNFGFGSALVQREDLREDHVSGVFWASLLLGVLLAVLVVVAAPFIAEFYGEPSVEPVLRALAAMFVLGAIVVAPKSLLQRRMDFESIAKVEATALLLGGGLAITLAWTGAGVWSLVTQQLAPPVVEATLVWAFVRWRPRTRFPMKGVKELAHYSLNLTGFNVVNYWARHADDILIGRVMGAGSLGLYDLAYRLMLFPIRQIIGAVSRVMFPTMSSVQDDRDQMRRIYLRVIRILALVSFPIMGFVAIVPDLFVLGVFGEQWAGAIPLVRIFCLIGMIQMLGNPTGWIYKATGRTDWMMWWGLAGGGLLITAIAVGVWLGSILTVAWAYAAANAVLLYPMVSIPGRLIGMSFTDVSRVVLPSGLATVGMAATVHLARLGLPEDWSPAVMLAAVIPAGAVAYIVISLFVNRKGCLEAVRAVHGLVPMRIPFLRRVRDWLA